MKILKWAALIILCVPIIAFSVSNREAVEIFLPLSQYSVEIPLYLVFFVIFLMGVILGGFASYFLRLKTIIELRACKKQLKLAQKINEQSEND